MKRGLVSFGSVLALAAGLFLIASEASATGPLQFFSITPCRIADTRGNGFTGLQGPPALAPNATRSFPVRGVSGCGIPSDAEAVVFNFTVVQPAQSGNLVAYPYGGAIPPLTSVLNYSAGEFAVGNGAIVPLGGTTLNVSVYVNVAPGSTATVHLVIDVTGYFKLVT
jgi:hypothetical protein